MWRFYAGNGCLKFVSRSSNRRIEVRSKYTDFSQVVNRLPSADFIQRDFNEIHNVTPDRPLIELTSFDDFGTLSFGKSSSMETVSSPETSFLDHILRTDSLPKYSGVSIPTTVDNKEMGGLSDLLGYDEAVQLLSEGMDVSKVVQDLTNIASQDTIQKTKIVVDEQKPSTSGKSDFETDLPFLIPRIRKADAVLVDENLPYLIPDTIETPRRTRRLLTEKMRQQRKNEVRSSSKDSSEFASLGGMFFPSELPQYMNVPVLETITTSDPTVVLETPSPASEIKEISLTLLEGMIEKKDFSTLCQSLQQSSWPEHLFQHPGRYDRRINAVLESAMEHSISADEASKILDVFAKSHPNACISDKVLLHVVARVASENDVEATISSVEHMGKMCLTRQRKQNFKSTDQALERVYEKVLEKETISTANNVLSSCISNKFDRSAETFMRTALKNAREKKSDFYTTMKVWTELSDLHGTTSGVDQMWMLAIETEDSASSMIEKKRRRKEGMARRFELLLNHCQKSDHPFASVAQMIFAFVRTNRLEEAEEIFKRISVSGRFFIRPLAEIANLREIETIERFAELITRCMLLERKRGKKEKAEEEKVSKLDEGVLKVLDTFYGIGNRKKVVKTFGKKQKRKIHRIDEEQLHDLTSELQVVWAKCAVSKNSQESAAKLSSWCDVNRIDRDPTAVKILNQFSKKSD